MVDEMEQVICTQCEKIEVLKEIECKCLYCGKMIAKKGKYQLCSNCSNVKISTALKEGKIIIK
jgi:hypothetical protein